MKSALYRGVVLHHRLRPKVHRLRYRLYWLLLDLDELPALHRSLRLFSFNRPNLLGFHERDHLDGSDTSLRTQIAAALAGANIPYDGGPIRVLCMPRALGSVFNPISVWFCHRKDESLAAMLYEVNNTFGERHSYLIPVAPDASGPIHQHCDKAFHVSPFMRMAMEYDFRVGIPSASSSAAATPAASSSRPRLPAGASLWTTAVWPGSFCVTGSWHGWSCSRSIGRR